MPRTLIDTQAAQKHFTEHDPVMAALLQTALAAKQPITVPVARPPEQYFASIVRSIIGQQISVKAAASIRARVETLLGHITPDTVSAADFDELKACGLSNQKTKYIKHNAALWPEIPSGNFGQLDDEAVITELTKLYGIGRWTAEMFLMSSLARPDVFSYGDHGLMQGLFQTYPRLKPHHNRRIATTINTWSPHKTLAALTLWWHKDNTPELT